MPKQEEERIACNPHNILLLKRMIEFEITGWLYGRVKRNEVIASIKKCPRIKEEIRDTVASYVEKSFWNKLTFAYVERHLDELCKLITKLGEFKNWKDFVSKYSKWRYSVKSEDFIGYITESDLHLAHSWVEKDLGKIYDRRRQEGKLDKPKHNLKTEGNEIAEFDIGNQHYTFSYSGLAGIEEIARLANAIYPCPINDSNAKKPWFKKNNRMFVICEDSSGELIANLNAIPLKDSFYTQLKNGLIYENEITPNDIFSLNEKDKVKCIYIEGFASISIYAQFKLLTYFPLIVSNLAKSQNPELTICAIGGSDEGDNLMKSLGFRQTGKSIDRRSSQVYAFLEIRWHDLERNILEKISTSHLLEKFNLYPD